MRYNTDIIKWKSLTEKQLRNHIIHFAGTEFELKAKEELKRRGIEV